MSLLIWVPATLAAAATQTVRNAVQHRLTSTLGTVGATQVRFLYGLPFALGFLGLVALVMREPVPPPVPGFLLGVAVGGVAQILATALLLAAMRTRSFGAAVAYSKTEPVQVALFGILILGDPLGLWTAAAIVLATAGVVLLSGPAAARAPAALLRPGAAAMGLASGAFFALTAVAIRGAILALPEGSFLMRATTTLAWTLAVQSAVLLVWLAVFDRAGLTGSLRVWRASVLAGLTGALASQLWFIGFATTTAANVRTLALVEVLFAALVSRRLLAQAIPAREWLGYALVVAGVGLLLAAAFG